MPRNQTYYWISAHHQGNDILIYGGETYEEAERKGSEKLPCIFEVIALPTIDIKAASRMLKGRKLEETGNLDESLKRMRHNY